MTLLATEYLIEEELVRQIERGATTAIGSLDIARELKPVVLSPYLPGEGDLVSIICARGLGKG